MKILIDTHTFLWVLQANPKLSLRATALLASPESDLFLSIASVWETVIKMRLGRLNGLVSSIGYIRDKAIAFGIEILPIRYEHLVALETLPTFKQHKDPFDRMLIAQGIAEDIPILTRDEKFQLYPVKLIW